MPTASLLCGLSSHYPLDSLFGRVGKDWPNLAGFKFYLRGCHVACRGNRFSMWAKWIRNNSEIYELRHKLVSSFFNREWLRCRPSRAHFPKWQIWVRAGSRATSGLFSAAIGSNGFAFNVGAGNIIRRSSYTASFSSWTTLSTDAAGALWFDVSTVDGENVIVVGADGTVYYSSSSGTTWIAAESGTTNDIYCVNHASSSSTFAMAAGALGYLAKTENGGSTWTTMTAFSSNYTARFRSISLLSTSEAYVAAYSATGASVGVIYRTLNGGIAWELIATVSDQVFSLSMLSSMYGVSGAATGIFTLVS
eukprot:gene37075-45002_t